MAAVKMTAEEKIAALKKKIEQVKALDEKKKMRELGDVLKHSSAQETRKKILVGAFVMRNFSEITKMTLSENRFIDSLVRDDDRALFGLSPLKKTSAAPAPAPVPTPTPAPARSRSPAPAPAPEPELAPLVTDFDMPLAKATDDSEMKRLGAKSKNGEWYVPAGVDARPFMKWF